MRKIRDTPEGTEMIYYSHVNEDNQVERQMMAQQRYTQLISIVGSGERVISLMDLDGLEEIYAIDINPPALYLLELKLLTLKRASVDHYLWFIGFEPGSDKGRLAFFDDIRKELSPESRNFWDNHRKMIKMGILNGGHFEGFMDRIRPLLRLSLGSGFYQCFQKPLSACNNFPYRRWQWLKKIFSHRLAYRLMGNRDVAFIATDAERSAIPTGLQAILDREIVDRSFMFHLLFQGKLSNMPQSAIPPSLQPAILQKIKTKLEAESLKVHYMQGDLFELCKKEGLPGPSPAFISMSDLSSFVNHDYLRAFFQFLKQHSNGKKRVVIRSFLRHRLNEKLFSWLKTSFSNTQDLSASEMTAMYQVWAFDHEKS